MEQSENKAAPTALLNPATLCDLYKTRTGKTATEHEMLAAIMICHIRQIEKNLPSEIRDNLVDCAFEKKDDGSVGKVYERELDAEETAGALREIDRAAAEQTLDAELFEFAQLAYDGKIDATINDGKSTVSIADRQDKRHYLRKNGYDGLCDELGGCACGLSDLMRCGDANAHCEPAYAHKLITRDNGEGEFVVCNDIDFDDALCMSCEFSVECDDCKSVAYCKTKGLRE